MIQRLETPRKTVDTEIEQAAASEVGIDHAVSGIGERGFGALIGGEVGQDAMDWTDPARGDGVTDVDRKGKVARPDGLHEEEILSEGR